MSFFSAFFFSDLFHNLTPKTVSKFKIWLSSWLDVKLINFKVRSSNCTSGNSTLYCAKSCSVEQFESLVFINHTKKQISKCEKENLMDKYNCARKPFKNTHQEVPWGLLYFIFSLFFFFFFFLEILNIIIQENSVILLRLMVRMIIDSLINFFNKLYFLKK